MRAYELATFEQLDFENAVGPPVAYKDKRIGLIVDSYLKVEDFFNKPKKATIDGIELESTGSWTGPEIVYEDGKRKLRYVCRSVNPYRYQNQVMKLRTYDNVIVPQAFKMLHRNHDKLKKMKFVSFDIQMSHDDVNIMYGCKPCQICPISYVSMESFHGEDLKTHTFDQPGKLDNIDTFKLEPEKFWAVCTYLSSIAIKLIRIRYPDEVLNLQMTKNVAQYLNKSFMSDIIPAEFNDMILPKTDEKYDLELWPSPNSEHFMNFIETLLPSVNSDPKLNFLKSNAVPMINFSA